jgi:hypothetical protein
LLACGRGSQGRNRNSDAERGNPMKPQTAAEHTYHVHQLQI